jgi:thiol-disulfide isomerase/thioredoxin
MCAKRYLLRYARLAPLIQQLRKLKYNKELFDAALKEQPKYAIPGEEWSIVLGNVEANNIITMVSNPYCQPCAKAHAKLDEALNNLDNIQIRIVFVGKNNSDEKSIKTQVHRHLMALNELTDRTIIKNALHDWYAQKHKNYDEWAKAYPVIFNPDTHYKLEKQKEWVEMAEIKATPTLLVNGYRLPHTYQLHELKYMLD